MPSGSRALPDVQEHDQWKRKDYRISSAAVMCT